MTRHLPELIQGSQKCIATAPGNVNVVLDEHVLVHLIRHVHTDKSKTLLLCKTSP